MAKKKRVAILTGGGDVPGLNVAIKAVVVRAQPPDKVQDFLVRPHPSREARGLAFAQVRRWVAPEVHLVPAAQFHRAQLRVLEHIDAIKLRKHRR